MTRGDGYRAKHALEQPGIDAQAHSACEGEGGPDGEIHGMQCRACWRFPGGNFRSLFWAVRDVISAAGNGVRASHRDLDFIYRSVTKDYLLQVCVTKTALLSSVYSLFCCQLVVIWENFNERVEPFFHYWD